VKSERQPPPGSIVCPALHQAACVPTALQGRAGGGAGGIRPIPPALATVAPPLICGMGATDVEGERQGGRRRGEGGGTRGGRPGHPGSPLRIVRWHTKSKRPRSGGRDSLGGGAYQTEPWCQRHELSFRREILLQSESIRECSPHFPEPGCRESPLPEELEMITQHTSIMRLRR
jgi:hypothetical protein